MVFPLFDLPGVAVDQVLDSVSDLEDKRALRLVCKRTRARVDSRVVAIKYQYPRNGEQSFSALFGAPWRLQTLNLLGKTLGFPTLRELDLSRNSISDLGVASLASTRWPALQKLSLYGNYVGAAGAASLAAAHLPALEDLNLSWNSVCDAGAAILATADWPHLQDLEIS